MGLPEQENLSTESSQNLAWSFLVIARSLGLWLQEDSGGLEEGQFVPIPKRFRADPERSRALSPAESLKPGKNMPRHAQTSDSRSYTLYTM